jgi:DNA repair exonuclease SbcCD ATPase subunit
MVQASSVSSASASRLAVLLQTTRAASDAEDAEWNLQAPGEAVAYTRSGTALLEALENLHRDAQEELETARKEESEAVQNYRLKKQSLEDSLKVAKRDLQQAKGELAESDQEKAGFSGNLKQTQADLAEDLTSQEELKKACLAKAQDYQVEAKERAQEFEALEKAEAAIKEKVEGVEVPRASLLDSGLASLLQVAASKSKGRLPPGEQVAHLVRSLGLAQDSSALMQLASRVESAVRLTPKAEELFDKIRGMIGQMLEQIQAEAKKEASKLAWCKKETSEAKEKQEEKDNWYNKFSSRVEKMIARQTRVNDEVEDLRQELSDLLSTQAQMDKLRIEEKTIFEKQRPEVQGALDGTQLAIKVLREYYGGNGNSRADRSNTVVELLEVAESDFSKHIAEMDTEEERAKVEYEKITKENQKTKLVKEQDIKYKAQESAEVAKALRELNNDLSASKEELDAVNEFLADLAVQCDLTKRETYEERVQKREAKMAMLNNCLKALEVTPSLLQESQKITRSHRPVLRGTIWPHKIG